MRVMTGHIGRAKRRKPTLAMRAQLMPPPEVERLKLPGRFSLRAKVYLLPDMNYSAMRANRWAQQRTADFWRTLIVSIIRPTHRPDVPLQNARARFTRHSSVQPDPAQLGMSFKAIEDAFCRSGWSSGKKKRWIQRAEVLHDDAPRYVTSSFHWAPAPARGGFITIEIDEIEGEGHVD